MSTAKGSHEVEIWFHFAAACRHEPAGANRIIVTTPSATLVMNIDPALEIASVTGGLDPICGWESKGYHQREPAISLVGRASIAGTARFLCSFELTATS